jgi:hypothetical protein
MQETKTKFTNNKQFLPKILEIFVEHARRLTFKLPSPVSYDMNFSDIKMHPVSQNANQLGHKGTGQPSVSNGLDVGWSDCRGCSQ